MTRLILHAGTHKTGTTSIQKVLADNRAFLRSHGLFYPDGRVPFGATRVPHHKFAHSLTGADPEGWMKATAFISNVRSQLKAGEVILISAEPIYRHQYGKEPRDHPGAPDAFWDRRRLYLEALRRTLHGLDVEILLFFRRRDAFAESLYRERLRKQRQQAPFDEFLAAFEPLFDYERQVGLFRSVFGQVRTESYDEAAAEGLVPTFFRVIGFPTPPGSDAVWERRSTDQNELFASAEARAAFLARYPATIPK